MKVLVAGAAGSIGRTVLAGLVAHGHEPVGVDLVPAPPGHVGPWHTADVSDPDAALAAVVAQPLDAVVHLAGIAGESDLSEALTSHVLTTGALLDAMLEADITRIVYASSNHAVGRTPRVDTLTTGARPRPDTFYGVAKVAAEGLLSLYADRYGIEAVACRIGSFLPHPETARHLATWQSPDDCVRMVEAALTAPSPGFAVLYGISDNTRAWWDLEPGRALGYHPQDDAERFASSIEPRPEDESEAAYVGGPFAGEAFYRPATARRAANVSRT